jgi:hypothetical protein
VIVEVYSRAAAEGRQHGTKTDHFERKSIAVDLNDEEVMRVV